MTPWWLQAVESFIAVMQILIFIAITGSVWSAFRTRRAVFAMLQSLYEYRREIAWMTARLEELEKGARANGRVEASRGK
jgi:hypothetical protein